MSDTPLAGAQESSSTSEPFVVAVAARSRRPYVLWGGALALMTAVAGVSVASAETTEQMIIRGVAAAVPALIMGIWLLVQLGSETIHVGEEPVEDAALRTVRANALAVQTGGGESAPIPRPHRATGPAADAIREQLRPAFRDDIRDGTGG